MPELPEIVILAEQLRQTTVGKEIVDVVALQPKNLNIPVDRFVEQIIGQKIVSVEPHGKWIFVKLSEETYLLLNLGMGGDLLYFESSQDLSDSYKFKLSFSDGSGFTINFAWFGYVHLIKAGDLKQHKMTRALGLSPLEGGFTVEYFRKLLNGRKGRVKSFLVNQKNVAGIGNVYIQDILFKARLHPNRKIDTLDSMDIERLYGAIMEVLMKSIRMRGLIYEKDIYGNRGGFSGKDFLVGYKMGEPCPACSSPIIKIKTGSTSSYICSSCQR